MIWSILIIIRHISSKRLFGHFFCICDRTYLTPVFCKRDTVVRFKWRGRVFKITQDKFGSGAFSDLPFGAGEIVAQYYGTLVSSNITTQSRFEKRMVVAPCLLIYVTVLFECSGFWWRFFSHGQWISARTVLPQTGLMRSANGNRYLLVGKFSVV